MLYIIEMMLIYQDCLENPGREPNAYDTDWRKTDAS